MKTSFFSRLSFVAALVLLAGLAVCGCATDKNDIAPPGAGSPDNGTLVVYSAYDTSADFNQRDPYRPEYSDYKILTANGTFYRRVHNNSGAPFQGPAHVTLPAGNYEVEARKNGAGWVTVPVTIQPGHNTVVRM